jgi:hypothetical protein
VKDKKLERKKERSEEDGMGILGKGNQLSQDVYLVKSPLELGQTTTKTMSGSFAPSKNCVLILQYNTTTTSVF